MNSGSAADVAATAADEAHFMALFEARTLQLSAQPPVRMPSRNMATVASSSTSSSSSVMPSPRRDDVQEPIPHVLPPAARTLLASPSPTADEPSPCGVSVHGCHEAAGRSPCAGVPVTPPDGTWRPPVPCDAALDTILSPDESHHYTTGGMEGPLEDLVEQLYTLFTGGDKPGVVSSDAEQGSQPLIPSQLFAIIEDVLVALTPAERARQQRIALDNFIHEVATDVKSGAQAGHSPSQAHLSASRLGVTVLTSCALLAAAQPPSGQSESHEANAHVVAAADLRAWEQCALQLFASTPPFPAQVIECAAYGAARLTLQQWAVSEKRVLSAACEAVQRLAPSLSATAATPSSTNPPAAIAPFGPAAALEAPLDTHVAVEVLAQVTSLLTLDLSLHVSGVVAAPPPPAASAKAAGRKGGNKTQEKKDKPHAAPQAQRDEKNVFCQPLGLREGTVREVREGIIRAALYALGGAEAMPTTTSTVADLPSDRTLTGRRDQVLSSLVCRRVLIPLLLLGGDETLLTYEPVVHRLLRSLGGDLSTPDAAAKSFLQSGGDTTRDSQHAADDDGLVGAHTPLPMAAARDAGEAEERRGEVVVLTAALFDFLFRTPDLNPEHDYRFSPFLWRTLHAALYDAIATPHLDAGRRANMQLRVEYLLKRLVDLTRTQEAAAAPAFPPAIAFHPELFVWCAEAGGPDAGASSRAATGKRGLSSAQSWSYFFLVLEALNEFGWHIIQPALVKLDAIVEELQRALVNQTGSPDAPVVTPLASAWVELLHLKLILHPNLGVRKVGLRRVWRLPKEVLASFSHPFLFTHVLESATDPRLCVELDRTPITATFLETKAFEGQEVRSVPDLEPLAHEVERFYAYLFLHQLPSAQLRTAAIRRLLRSLLSKPPRFTVSMAVRTLHYVAQQLLVEEANAPERQAWTCAMMLDEEVLASLGVFLRDSIQENIPFWLDVRVTAILFSVFLHFAALAPRRFRTDSRYWRLMCLCGPLGQSGGKSIARMDACGSAYGCVGSSLDPSFLHAKVAHFVLHELPDAYAPTHEAKAQFVADLLLLDTMTARTRALLTSDSSVPSSATFDEVAIKQHFFLLGAPLAFDELAEAESHADNPPAKPQWLKEVCDMVTEHIVSLRKRAYPPLASLLTSTACLIALEQTLSPRRTATFFETEALAEMLETVRGHAMRALNTAHARMLHVESADELSGKTSSLELASHAAVTGTSAAAAEVLEAWQLMHTEVWDLLTSGVASLHKLTVHRTSGTDAPTTTADVSTYTPSVATGVVSQLVALVQSCGTHFAEGSHDTAQLAAQGGGPSTSASPQAWLARQAAEIVVARNTSRLLLSELCGLLFTEVEESTQTAEADTQFYGAPSVPFSVEGSLHRLRTAVPGFSASATLALVVTLTGALTQRLTTSALPGVLSGLPWPTVLAQHSRAVYNTIYILAESLSPSSLRGAQEPTLADVECSMARESLVPALESFAMEQLEQCWSSCLPSVMDLLVWVAATKDPRVDCVGVVDAVFAHVHDVGARQHARASALAFTVLLLALPHAPTHVHDVLMRTLKTEVEATDRNVYLVAITACLGVLQSPSTRYDGLVDVLVQCAVLFNSGRDEEENESTMATTEPLLKSWPVALRTRYPPTVRLSAVGRALCLSTLLWCCAHDPERLRAVELVTRLLRMNTRDPIVSHEPCMPNSQTHRTRLRLWQLLCALLPTLPCDNLDKVTPLFQTLLEECVPINNMGSVRRFMELFAIRLLEEQPSLYTLVSDALGDYSLRPQVCGTFVLVASHALLHDQRSLPPSSNDDDDNDGRTPLFNALFPRLLQQSTSNQHLLRIISHIGVHVVCRARLDAGRSLPAEASAMFDYIARAPEHVKLREKHQDMLFFDTKEACRPRSLFCVQRKEANTILQEHIPAAAFERIRFLETEVACLIGAVQPIEVLRVRLLSESVGSAALLDRFRDFALIPHTRQRADYYVDYAAEATRMLVTDPLTAGSPDLSAAGAEDDIQKKVTSWWNSAVYNELHPRAVQRQTRQSLVIVGSLLENPVNIAGLCRCGEIFAVERITIPEKKVFDHPHFVATARSAELWIPWLEVAPKDLPTYLAAMRENGYLIVGIEQTASSVSIADFAFPERVVVVLGAEGQGVPAPLIPLLDVCVEIPQYGLIRSLNVHVTGAITMFEYTRQHLMTTEKADSGTS